MNTKKLEVNTIIADNYSVRAAKLSELADILETLPAVQIVRGSVMAANTATALVEAAKAGLYIPPIVLAGNAENSALTDGQQRMTQLLRALTAGQLTGDETILVALDTARTIEESFEAMNVGTPVGAALVGAMGMPGHIGESIISLAGHKFLSDTRWTGAQTKRTARAEFAAVLLAIAAGWDMPESNTKSCTDWLRNNEAAITPEMAQTAYDTLDKLVTATTPIHARAELKGKAGKESRAILALLRRKNLFMTVVAAMVDNCDVNMILRVLPNLTSTSKCTYIHKLKNGREVKREAVWAVGGGSSGSYSEYVDRLRVLEAACVAPDKYPAPANKTDKDFKNTDAQSLAAAMGLEVEVTK